MAKKTYNGVTYDDSMDYSIAIEKATTQEEKNRLTNERNAKIADMYGGKEPTMYGSDKTYSQLSGERSGGNSGAGNAISSAVKTGSANYSPYAGTDYHQNAIDAAIGGDWDAVVNALKLREDKTNFTGENYGKSSAEIYAELWDQYGTPIPAASGGTGFNYDDSSKPTFESAYDSRIDELLNELLNRDAFSYNVETDPLYKQYASMYQREGQRAMNDAMASAAAAAGGMNSYAMTAANQANNYYMAQMNDKIPELYQLAYDMYLKDIDNQVRDLGLLSDMDDKQYNRYRDTMSDWYADKNFAYNQYRDDVGDYWQQKNFDNANSHWQQEFDHTVGQDAIKQENRDQEWEYETGHATGTTAYNKAMDLLNAGAMPTDEMLAEAGMTKEQAATILAGMQMEMGGVGSTGGSDTGSSSSDSSGSDPVEKKPGGGYDNGGLTTAQIKELQRYYGVTADGLWGNNSKSAAGGKSADAAWKAYQKTKDNDDDDVPELNWSSMNDLGLGPVSATEVAAIQAAGGIIEDGKGNVYWAPGWNASNYEKKMKTVPIGLQMPTSWLDFY